MLARVRMGTAVAIISLAVAAPALAAPAGSTLLVSRPDGFGPVPPALDNDSRGPVALSDDGRYALFRSQADGFAPGVNPFAENLFVRDTLTGTTTLVNRSDGFDGAGSEFDANDADLAVTSVGGQPHVLVVFATFSTNLVDHATGSAVNTLGREQVWLRDVTAGQTTLVSRADTATGVPANNNSGSPAIAIAGSGPVVVFQSNATNLGATSSGGVYMRRMGVNDTELVSCRNRSCGGTPAAAFAFGPDVTTLPAAPGHPTCSTTNHNECIFVAFATTDTTVTEDPDARTQVMMAVAEPGVTATNFLVISRADQSIAGFANAGASSPSFSGDGQAVAFLSSATNLTLDTMTPGLQQQAFMRIPGGAISSDSRTFLLSKATDPANATVSSVQLAGSVTQPRAVFSSSATNLGAANQQGYVRDHATSTTSLLGRAPGPGGVLGNRFFTSQPVISGDGTVAMFAGNATNLGDGDSGRFTRVRTRRLTTAGQEVELVSRPSGFDAFKSLTDVAFGVATSADGRFVAFGSRSASLSDDDVDGSLNVFVRDLLTGRTVLTSRGPGVGGAPSTEAVLQGLSGDGRKVVFTAANVTADSPADVPQVYVRDLDADTTTLVSRANGPAGTPSLGTAGGAAISEDGKRVAFASISALDPAGADGNFHIYLRDLVAATTILVDRDDGINGVVAPVGAFEADVNGDGNRVAWVSKAAYAGAPGDGKTHVFIRDLRAGTTALVSRAEGAQGASADQDSRAPALNGAGDVVAFNSQGQNLGETFVNSQVFVRDLNGAHTQLVSRASGAGAIGGSAFNASLDAAGQRVSFSSSGNLDDTLSPQPPFASRIFVRDLPSAVTTLVSRANGVAGAPSNSQRSDSSDITANGDCVAFQSASTNLDDGFASADFDAIHMRVLRNECPVPGALSPAPPATPIPAPAASATPAVLSRLAMKPSRFRVSGRGRGTRISFRLDRTARVTLTFERLLPARRKGRRCSTKQRKGRRCTVVRQAGRLAVSGRSGTNSVSFSGVLARKRIAVGRYRLRAQPAAGRARTVSFVVLPAR